MYYSSELYVREKKKKKLNDETFKRKQVAQRLKQEVNRGKGVRSLFITVSLEVGVDGQHFYRRVDGDAVGPLFCCCCFWVF